MNYRCYIRSVLARRRCLRRKETFEDLPMTTISSGVTSSGIAVSSGDSLFILSGGSAPGTTIPITLTAIAYTSATARK
jgi:hypothetical protein